MIRGNCMHLRTTLLKRTTMVERVRLRGKYCVCLEDVDTLVGNGGPGLLQNDGGAVDGCRRGRRDGVIALDRGRIVGRRRVIDLVAPLVSIGWGETAAKLTEAIITELFVNSTGSLMNRNFSHIL